MLIMIMDLKSGFAQPAILEQFMVVVNGLETAQNFNYILAKIVTARQNGSLVEVTKMNRYVY